MISKRIVPHKEEAMRLYQHDLRECQIQGYRYKRVSQEDFMAIFNKRMFVDSLMRVILKIQDTNGTLDKSEISGSTIQSFKAGKLKDKKDEVPLPLKINQFER
jgi:hypothetical protein